LVLIGEAFRHSGSRVADRSRLARPALLRRVDAALACRRALEAIERSDDVPAVWIDENFGDNRVLAIARITASQLAVKG
jgi:hypothetical protein